MDFNVAIKPHEVDDADESGKAQGQMQVKTKTGYGFQIDLRQGPDVKISRVFMNHNTFRRLFNYVKIRSAQYL